MLLRAVAASSAAALRRGGGTAAYARRRLAHTLDTPFISDTVPLAEGLIGPVEELLLAPGDAVQKDDVIAVVDTAKVSLDVKATRSGVIEKVLVNVGDEVKECQPLYSLQDE